MLRNFVQIFAECSVTTILRALHSTNTENWAETI